MILTEEVEMRWNPYNKKTYMDLGYNYTKIYDIFLLKVEHLNKGSHYKIDVCCDICGKQFNKNYKSYNECTKKHGIYTCSCCRYESIKLTNLKLYGVENVFTLPEIIKKVKKYHKENSVELLEKRTKTNLSRYGCVNPYQIKDIIEDIVIKSKKTKLDRGINISDDKLSDFEIYKRKVRNLTRKNKKILFEKWLGYDYYDGEYIKENFVFNFWCSKYPTIDHKVSIIYGFLNNMTIEEIGDINNLCITKKFINCTKRHLNEDQFNYKKKRT